MFGLLLQITIGDTSATGAVDEMLETAATDDLNFLDLAMKGGWIMLPIIALSIIAVYIFVERYLSIKKAKKEDPRFMASIKEYIVAGDLDAAHKLAENNNSPIGRVIATGISRVGCENMADVSMPIENHGKIEINRLEKGTSIIATCAGAAPMIGFLGTVMGMILAFHDMANIEGGNLSVSTLANGIYTAMVTTVAGLVVGIIAYLAYNVIVAQINSVAYLIEERAAEFMDLLNQPAK